MANTAPAATMGTTQDHTPGAVIMPETAPLCGFEVLDGAPLVPLGEDEDPELEEPPATVFVSFSARISSEARSAAIMTPNCGFTVRGSTIEPSTT